MHSTHKLLNGTELHLDQCAFDFDFIFLSQKTQAVDHVFSLNPDLLLRLSMLWQTLVLPYSVVLDRENRSLPKKVWMTLKNKSKRNWFCRSKKSLKLFKKRKTEDKQDWSKRSNRGKTMVYKDCLWQILLIMLRTVFCSC